MCDTITKTVTVNMDMTVAVVDEAFLDKKRMDHSGALMCFSSGSSYETAKVDLSLMPVGRFSLYPKPEGRQFFINKEMRIFGRIYQDTKDKKMKVISLVIEENSYADMHSEDVLESLSKFLENLTLKQKPVITETIEELQEFMKTLDNKKLEGTLDYQLSHFNRDVEPVTRMYLALASWYGDYWMSYANFLKAHTMNDKEFKKFIRELENLPKFGMETLKWESYQSVYRLVADFLKYHYCNNKDCGGFSFKKCSKCDHSHFCNRECQIKAFPYHKNECDLAKSVEGYKKEVPWIIKNYVDEGLFDDSDHEVVTMEVFLRELMMKAYSSFHDTLKDGEKSIHATMIYVLIRSKRFNHPEMKIDYKKMDQLLSRDRTAGSFDLLCKQMLEFPGKEKEGIEIVEKEGYRISDQLYDRVRFWMSVIALKIPNFEKEAETILAKWGLQMVPEESVEEIKASATAIKILTISRPSRS